MTPFSHITALPPYDTPGNLLYKCRRCGAEYAAYPVNDVTGTLKAIQNAYNQLAPAPGDPARLALVQMHGCPDGMTGLGDVTGMSVNVAFG